MQGGIDYSSGGIDQDKRCLHCTTKSAMQGGVTVNHNQLHCCGWVGMAGGVDCWGKIKINDQLGPSEEETGTELGKK